MPQDRSRPTKITSPFHAPGDGIYWLRVVQVHKNGMQEPDDRGIMKGPPDMKVVIDTVSPIIKTFQCSGSTTTFT